jgi:heme-degrading monooxygenase HmoA
VRAHLRAATLAPSPKRATGGHRTVLPTLQAIAGYHGAYLLRRDHDGHVEPQVLTLWESLESVRRFAGTSLDHAVVDTVSAATDPPD